MYPSISPQNTNAWKALEAHIMLEMGFTLEELFEQDQERFRKFSLEVNDIFLDFSKTHIVQKTLDILLSLAYNCELPSAIQAMFSGEKINQTENRAVLHTALRNFSDEPVFIDGDDIMPEIQRVRDQIKDFSEKLHVGALTGYSGKKIDTIVNIGIGGSDLGPKMVCNALKHYAVEGISIHFVSNIDNSDIHETLKQINPETSLFLIVSKTFNTQETISNAQVTREWLSKNSSKEAAKQHFFAVTANNEAAEAFGINTENIFRFWDFIGGRFSLWSAVGLSIACYIGYDHFDKFLRGAHQMDKHFQTAPFKENMPVIMALLSILYINFHDMNNEAILPYDYYLKYFPSYLQQVVMESNGKSVNRLGYYAELSTSPIIWGEVGTNSQHSFFQLIHQGTVKVPAIFMAPAIPLNGSIERHNILLSNFIAQTEALMRGKQEEEVLQEMKKKKYSSEEIDKLLPYKIFDGDSPTFSLLYKKLTPEILGNLIALFEHRTFVQGVIWNIYSFDQFGVELGKELAKEALPELEGKESSSKHDVSTKGLIEKIKKLRTEQ
ncbi:MAG: glucose-6-phosphate isomerase [Bacteroidales bacterium]|nr:glucose-6-phosphate isomerase [Bacteroidales bacterium]